MPQYSTAKSQVKKKKKEQMCLDSPLFAQSSVILPQALNVVYK